MNNSFDYDESLVFEPEGFHQSSVESIADRLEDKLLSKFNRKYSNIDIDVINYTDHSVMFHVDVYNNASSKRSGTFEFEAYPEYWDISDYQQHIDTTIHKFVENL